jgi:hypothetical protein
MLCASAPIEQQTVAHLRLDQRRAQAATPSLPRRSAQGTRSAPLARDRRDQRRGGPGIREVAIATAPATLDRVGHSLGDFCAPGYRSSRPPFQPEQARRLLHPLPNGRRTLLRCYTMLRSVRGCPSIRAARAGFSAWTVSGLGGAGLYRRPSPVRLLLPALIHCRLIFAGQKLDSVAFG